MKLNPITLLQYVSENAEFEEKRSNDLTVRHVAI
jgi:hypothetical protein